MAISAASVWEVRTTGADTNSGAFVVGASGTDRSQQDAAFANGTNLTVDASTNTDVAPDGYTPVSADIGNLIQITTTGGGAAFTVGFYEIKSIQAGKWRLDRSPAATSSAGATWAMGGALASPGKAWGAVVDGNTIWVKAGTYLVTSTSSNVANGRLTISVAAFFRGYNASRGDLSLWSTARPVIKAAVNSVTLVTPSVNGYFVADLIFDGDNATRTSTNGASGINQGRFWNCEWRNFTGTGFSVNNASAMFCAFIGNGANGGSGRGFLRCVAYGNASGSGLLSIGGPCSFAECIAAGNLVGIQCNNDALIVGSVCYGNSGDGVDVASVSTIVNSIIYGNGGYGIDDNGLGASGLRVRNCAFGSNASGASRSLPADANVNSVTLTGDPCVDGANKNFALNMTAGAGAAVRGVGYGDWNLTSIGYPAIGAAQPYGIVPPFETDGGLQ